MSYAGKIIANDLRNILRDRLYIYIFLIYPAAIVAVSRFLVPWVADNLFSQITSLYYLLFMMLANIVAVIFGFITAFLIMDERDENLLTALRVMPISRSKYLLYRMTLMTVLAFAWVSVLPALTGLIDIPFLLYLPVAVMFAMIVPIMALLVNVFASNKVQGFAMMKMLGGVFLLPLLAFFLHGSLEFMRYVFGVLPNFWTYMALKGALDTGAHDFLHLGIGLAVQIALIVVLFRVFNRRF